MQAGWARREIAITPRGLGMQGYGKSAQRDTGHKTPLFARAVVLGVEADAALLFCCLDLGYITHAMRQGVIAALETDLGAGLDADRLVLTCTHTHSGPGGCSHDIMYNLVTPGFAPDYLAAIVAAASGAILAAWRGLAPASLALSDGGFSEDIDVAWNRSLAAYRRNADAAPWTAAQAHLALDRSMAVLSLRRAGGVEAVLSLFGVHATCIGSSNTLYDGDNKGRAALHAEDALRSAVHPIRWRSSRRRPRVTSRRIITDPARPRGGARSQAMRNTPTPNRMAGRKARAHWPSRRMPPARSSTVRSMPSSPMSISPP